MSRHTYPNRGSLYPATAVPTISTRYDDALIMHISDCLFTSHAAHPTLPLPLSYVLQFVSTSHSRNASESTKRKRNGPPSSKEFLPLCGISVSFTSSPALALDFPSRTFPHLRRYLSCRFVSENFLALFSLLSSCPNETGAETEFISVASRLRIPPFLHSR